MSALDQEQDVVDLADKLGLTGSPVAAIINRCQEQIDTWVREAGGVASVDELEAVVADRLNLVFEEINEESDIDRLKAKYVPMGEPIFAALHLDLIDDTYGTMIRLKAGTHVAVIDCRGEKAARRFFTRWHEIAHLLVEEDVDKQVFRSTNEPLERLMDQIAGHVGFYDSLFSPLFHSHLPPGEILTFEIVDAIRQGFCSYASFQSTLFACQRRLPTPLVYIEAGMGYKVEEQRKLNSKQMTMFEESTPEAKLRVSMTVPNATATNTKLRIIQKMRVPESSVIHRLFANGEEESSGQENLKAWEFSDGGSLTNCDVWIEARRLPDRVIAIVQPM